VAEPRGPFAPQERINTAVELLDPQADKGTRIIDVSLPAAIRKAVRQAKREEAEHRAGSAAGSLGIEGLATSIRRFYARLHWIDRWTLLALGLSLFAAFLPWCYLPVEGLLAGIQDFGVFSAGAAAVALLCIYGRTARRRLSGLLLLLQIPVVAVVAAAPIYRFLFRGGAELSFGFYLTALGGLAAVVLTLMRLTRFSS